MDFILPLLILIKSLFKLHQIWLTFIIIVIDLIAVVLDDFLFLLLTHLLHVRACKQVFVQISSDLCLVYVWHHFHSLDFFITFIQEYILVATLELRRSRAVAHYVSVSLALS